MSTHHPDPSHYPSYRKPSSATAPRFHSTDARDTSARAFSTGASTYHDVRPGYPDEVVALAGNTGTVVDIGAGTGKLTQALPHPQVLACDPSADMARQLHQNLGVPTWRATAEHTALSDASIDTITCAQTWHWVDVEAASAEFDRILRPGGTVVLAWNTIDVEADPWILRLTRIMHSGDILRAGFTPKLATPWQIDEEVRTRWVQRLTIPEVHQLMHTRSYWLRSKAAIRERMTANLNWYLHEHLGFAADDIVEITYRSDAFLLRRA
ncbi:class I SAM-dependent methyltransferase [Corynebacterium camporealensis]